jgi:hypothetical protein
VIVVAHVGHWLVDLLYVVPLILVAAIVLAGKLRERRADRDRKTGGLQP